MPFAPFPPLLDGKRSHLAGKFGQGFVVQDGHCSCAEQVERLGGVGDFMHCEMVTP